MIAPRRVVLVRQGSGRNSEVHCPTDARRVPRLIVRNCPTFRRSTNPVRLSSTGTRSSITRTHAASAPTLPGHQVAAHLRHRRGNQSWKIHNWVLMRVEHSGSMRWRPHTAGCRPIRFGTTTWSQTRQADFIHDPKHFAETGTSGGRGRDGQLVGTPQRHVGLFALCRVPDFLDLKAHASSSSGAMSTNDQHSVVTDSP
jgi:hypothetical protein